MILCHVVVVIIAHVATTLLLLRVVVVVIVVVVVWTGLGNPIRYIAGFFSIAVPGFFFLSKYLHAPGVIGILFLPS